MNTLLAKNTTGMELLPAGQFFQPKEQPLSTSAKCEVKFSNHYNNQVVYAANLPGEISQYIDDYTVIITLSAIRNLHWSVETLTSETINAPAGTVIIIPGNNQIALKWPVESDYIQLFLEDEDLKELTDLTGNLGLRELFPYPSCSPNPKALQIAHLMRAELQKNAPVSSGYIKALLAVCVGQLVQNHSFLRPGMVKNESGGLSYQASRQIEAYLRENYSSKVSISDMATLLGVSGGHFLTSFRETFGQTPHQFLLMLRLNAVEDMLLETDHTLAEIAYRTGFSSQSHMTTALKKCRMVTPGEVRRKRMAGFK